MWSLGWEFTLLEQHKLTTLQSNLFRENVEDIKDENGEKVREGNRMSYRMRKGESRNMLNVVCELRGYILFCAQHPRLRREALSVCSGECVCAEC